MTTIFLGRPENNQGEWTVFGSYEGSDDRYTFGVRMFEAHEGERAEEHANRMMVKYEADHFVRL